MAVDLATLANLPLLLVAAGLTIAAFAGKVVIFTTLFTPPILAWLLRRDHRHEPEAPLTADAVR